MNYKEFLYGLSLRHFHPQEVLSQGERWRGAQKNSLPPESKWRAIVPTLWVADMARERLGFSLTITSAYRSPDYNKAVGSTAGNNSQHVANTALDLIPSKGRVKQLYDQLIAMRSGGAFKGGVGIYTGSGFVHVDTRGKNATWGKR
tara:strand:+ start:1827 stop:2264 length:438 start_codon:yes stop_codon:yes gene_type:complete